MKIVHIVRMNNNGDIGGVEYHVRYLVQSQFSQGHQPIIFTFALSDSDNITTTKRDGVEWHSITIKYKQSQLYKWLKRFEGKGFGLLIMLFERLKYNFYSGPLLDYIRDLNPDIVHQHDYLPSLRLSNKLSQYFPLVFTNHFGEYLYLDKFYLTRLLQKYFLRRFDKIIAPSRELLPSGENCYYMPNGYDSDRFEPITDEEKHDLKVKHQFQNKVVMLCARRWAPTKGILYLAEALTLLEDDVKENLVVLFAGNDSTDYELYKSQVASMLAKADSKGIHLLGNLNHEGLREYLQMADFCVIPSLMEAISLFAIESFGSGKPVLATETGGLPEVVKPGINGWLVPKADAQSLSLTISEIVRGRPESIMEIDTDYYEKHFSWNKIGEKVIEIYQSIANKTITRAEGVDR